MPQQVPTSSKIFRRSLLRCRLAACPVKLAVPTMCSLDCGAVVPMPTFVSAVAPFTPLILPSTSELLCVTIACEPMAVALTTMGLVRVDAPSNVFLSPFAFTVVVKSAPAPTNVFNRPLELDCPAPDPKKELEMPTPREDTPKLFKPALKPKKVLSLPDALACPAWKPKKEFLLPDVFAWPLPTPAKRLLVPALLRMRSPPMLNCEVAFKTFPDSVPPAVPLPAILKLVPDCWVVAF